MKKQRITVITAKLLAALMVAAVVFGSVSMEARAEQTGTVTVDNAKVRSDASTDSSVVSTLANGTTISVNGEKSDSSGNVWYQVTLSDGKTGYVRSDLMNVTETADAADASAGDAADTGDAGAADMSSIAGGVDVTAISNPEGVTPQDLQSAKINTNGKVRSDASTNDDIVAQLSQGTEMVISGSKLGSDSKTWYYVTFIDGGATKNGYIRSDLVDIGEVIIMPTAQPEEPVETPEEEQPVVEEVNNDYELVYTDDGTGNNVWWLYNHVDNTREKLQELLDFADSQASKTATLTSTNQKLKLICIVLGALLAIAVIAVIVMAVKLASGGYDYDDDDDDDDDEDDDDEDDEPVRRRGRGSRRSRYDDDDDDDDEDDEEEERRPRRRSTQTSSRDRDRAPRRRVEYDEDDDIRVDAPAKKSKPKNFMLDDDDFEFEFLNMDDK